MMERDRQGMGKMPTGYPFRVPEGYFDGFASQVMDRLPERTPVELKAVGGTRHRLWAWIAAAACVCVGIFSTAMYFAKTDSASHSGAGNEAIAHSATSVYDTDEDAFADYVMIDNADIYAYLTDVADD